MVVSYSEENFMNSPYMYTFKYGRNLELQICGRKEVCVMFQSPLPTDGSM
jgi:hypothetical protein